MKKIILCMMLVLSALFSAMSVSADRFDRWDFGDWNFEGNKNNGAKVGFFIQIGGIQMDTNGNVSGQKTEFFTNVLATSTLSKSLPSNYSVAIGNGVTESDITKNLSSVPKQKDILKKVVSEYEDRDAYIKSSNGKVIPWSKMTTDYYKVQWYVLKKESDFWHVDGVIIDLETDKEISIVVPDEKTERAACVEYDVQKGTFTPGFMNVKPNRPHAIWEGDNDNLIIEGFNDIWYTVLDEKTFKENNYAIPTKLMNAATAVEKLASARLSELDSRLQNEYGRIDSQAYKQEYIERKGSGTTLYVTPFISDMLEKKYSVSNDDYIWLAEGDTNGNICKVYVMDRKAAGVDNLFDNE